MASELIETLTSDNLVEYFGRIEHTSLERLFFDRGLKTQFKELSEREKATFIILYFTLSSNCFLSLNLSLVL